MTINGVTMKRSTLVRLGLNVKPIEFVVVFQKYMDDWRALDREYYRTPSWRIFKQLSITRKQAKLTQLFTARMIKHGIIKE